MMRILLMILMLINTATVDRIEEGIAVIEVAYNNEITMVNVPTEDFNNPIDEGDRISIDVATGTFAAGFEDLDGNEYYQFKSEDDSVWWALTAEEIGFVPEVNKEYTLIYHDNGTTDCTECAEELNCECEVYDDIFLAVFEGGK